MREALDGQDLARFQRGEPETFRHLVEKHSPRLLALARSYARDSDDAHDLVQDTWFRIYKKRHDFSARGTFIGWAMSVCRNVCLDVVAKRTSRDQLSNAVLDASSILHETGTDAQLNRIEIRRSLRDSLLDLPPRERDVVIMRLLDGFSVRETAQRLDVAEGTVKATLHHALKKLRSSMEVWAR